MKTTTRLLATIASLIAPLALMAQEASEATNNLTPKEWSVLIVSIIVLVLIGKACDGLRSLSSKPSKSRRYSRSTPAKRKSSHHCLWKHHQDLYRDWGIYYEP